MKCPKCKTKLKIVRVSIEGSKGKAKSYQCPKCAYFRFEKKTTEKIIDELQQEHLKMKHKIVKLSHNRLGMYFNKNIISHLNLQPGEEIYVTVPDRKHLLISIQNRTF